MVSDHPVFCMPLRKKVGIQILDENTHSRELSGFLPCYNDSEHEKRAGRGTKCLTVCALQWDPVYFKFTKF